MKISSLKINDLFLTDTNTEFRLIATPEMLTKTEKKNNPDRYKCLMTSTGKIYYLMNNELIRKK
jgi:hypothetical protein